MYANVEVVAQTAREDVERAVRTVLGRLASRARTTLGDEFLDGVTAACWRRTRRTRC